MRELVRRKLAEGGGPEVICSLPWSLKDLTFWSVQTSSFHSVLPSPVFALPHVPLSICLPFSLHFLNFQILTPHWGDANKDSLSISASLYAQRWYLHCWTTGDERLAALCCPEHQGFIIRFHRGVRAVGYRGSFNRIWKLLRSWMDHLHLPPCQKANGRYLCLQWPSLGKNWKSWVI